MNLKVLFCCVFLMVACTQVQTTESTSWSAQRSRASISERMLAQCHAMQKIEFGEVQIVADLLAGKVISASEIRGPGFKVATFWKTQNSEEVEIFFEVEGETQLTLGDLSGQFGPFQVIYESKTSAVRFDPAPAGCKDVFISARLFESKITEKSHVLSLKMRKSFDRVR